ncbi:uncharacterized protein LOC122563059 isoform X2 [Chiloscyllium plagiosum]|uniref:uncharacterized protein LOC122563059 isoform X2 n=1 Tax=Chiloscyllium plagiosum TaxID=36176 RepID=UPI001CB80D91|nr:uncharacterized protein LOC122563059 isoform X2 [Chiloscyllium plagiosum]
MKKLASLCKLQALCCLSLLVFLPVIATDKWCNSPDDFKWLTEQLQIKINNLNDNLLPSMIKYNTFTNMKTAVLTDRCFIIVTAEQLNNSLQLLMSHFKTNSSNYHLTQQVVTFLNILHTHCSDENSHQCSKPDTKVVTGCKSDLFAYFHAILNHYIYIFDQCNPVKQATEQSEGYLSLLKASEISIASNCCLIDLHNGSHSSYLYRDSPTKPLYNVSTPEPFCSLMSPIQSVTGYKLIPSTEATSAVTNVLTEDKSTVTKKDPLFGSTTDDPHNSTGNLMQTEVNNGGSTVPNMQPASISAASPSQTLSKPTGAAGKAGLHEDKQHTNTHLFQYLFIGTAVALVLTLSALVHSHFKIRRLKQRLWNKDLEDHDTETSKSFLTTEI